MYSLNWKSHSDAIVDELKNLYSNLQSCDVTLVADGHSARAHRVVLSSCSDFLRNLLLDAPIWEDATIVMPNINGLLLDNLLSFIYNGEIILSSQKIPSFLEVLAMLGINLPESKAIKRKHLVDTKKTEVQDTEPQKTKVPSLDVVGTTIALTKHPLDTNKTKVQDTEPQKTKVPSLDVGSSTIAVTDLREIKFKLLDSYPDPLGTELAHPIEHMSKTNDINNLKLTEQSAIFTVNNDVKIENTKFVYSEEMENEIIISSDEEIEHSMDDNFAGIQNPDEHLLTPLNDDEINKTKDEPEDIAFKEAYERLSTGQPCKTISRDVGLPLTTIYRYRQRLEREGRIPVYGKRFSKNNFVDSELRKAIRACSEDGMSIHRAASLFSVPHTTLWRHVQKLQTKKPKSKNK